LSFEESFSYEILQQTERWPRTTPTVDPIAKVEFRISDNHTFALALRDSGYVDIYSDQCRSDTVEGKL
jgi:hypothetical protein